MTVNPFVCFFEVDTFGIKEEIVISKNATYTKLMGLGIWSAFRSVSIRAGCWSVSHYTNWPEGQKVMRIYPRTSRDGGRDGGNKEGEKGDHKGMGK